MANAESAMVEFRLLGALELRVGGAPVEVGGPRQRALFAILLAQRGEMVGSGSLVEALWPEDNSVNPDGALRAYLSRLRRALRDGGAPSGLLLTEARGYRLDVSAAMVDADRFTQLANAAQQAAEEEDTATFDIAERALEWWRGQPFVEFTGQPWAQSEIRRLTELHTAVLEARAAGLLLLGRPAEAVIDLERLVASHPRRESLMAQLALGLYRSSRQSDALDRLARYRGALREEAGLQPGPRLARLEAQILQHDPALVGPNLPGRPLRSYVLGAQLGEGAFAEVFQGTQPSVGRSVAIKVIRPELANRPEFVLRFEAEAHLVARLEHPHVVPLYDYWREPDRAFLVMRLLRGGTLEQQLSSHGPLSLAAAATMIRQVGAALGAAHRCGVVHRDVKPANVFLDGEGNFYLGDFGIALGAAEAVDPESSLSAGSPAYAAPEQLRREPVGPAADVWGLGITLYEALTGRLPFPDEDTQAGLFRRYTTDPVPPTRATRPDVPAGVDDAIERATAKNPSDRWHHVADMIDALEAAFSGQRGATPRRGRVTATAIGHSERNPYKGLAAFTEADAPDFFGRARLVDQLLALLRRDGPSGRIIAVVGPSGIGKSSVVRAGLLPALRRGAVHGSDRWFVATMLPGNDPFEELAPALLRVAVSPPPSNLASLLAEDSRGLTRIVKAIVPDGSGLLLVIDQFEEIFTLATDELVRRRFLAALEHAVTDLRCPLRVVLTLRADFYDRPLRYGDFARLLRDGTVPVLPLAADELERAIAEPAGRAGVELESGLLSRIVTDVADQPAALPILQYALTQLFDQRASGMLTVSAYDRLGGVSGALAQRAEQLLEESGPQDAAAARRLFGRLITLGEGVEDTRRRVLRTDAGTDPATNAAIERFGAARLLSFDRDPLSREPTVEVSHEALIRAWPRLRQWLDEDREQLRTHRHLSEAATAWVQRGREPGELYRAGRLDTAADWQATHTGDLNDTEAEFLAASLALRDREQSDLRRANRRLRTRLIAVAALAVVALIAAGTAVVAQRAASRNADTATARTVEAEQQRLLAQASEREATRDRLVAETKAQASTDRVLAMLLAREANALEDTIDTQNALYAALMAEPKLVGNGLPGATSLFRVHIAVDNTIIGVDEWLRVYHWDPTGSKLLDVPWTAMERETPISGVFALVALNDRHMAVSDNSTVTLFDLVARRQIGSTLHPPPAPSGTPLAVAFGPDASTLYVGGGTGTLPGSGEGTITTFDVLTGQQIAVLHPPHTAAVMSVLPTPDGRRLISGGLDATVVVWDLAQGAPVFPPLLGHRAPVESASISPDGRYLATANTGAAAVYVWDSSTGTRLAGPFPATGISAKLVFDSNGHLFIAGNGGPIDQWDVPSATKLATWDAQLQTTGVALLGSGELLVVGNRIARFAIDGTTSIGTLWPGTSPLLVAWSPDPTRAATLDAQANATLVDATSGAAVGPVRAGTVLGGVVGNLVFDPAGAVLAVGRVGGIVERYDAHTGEPAGESLRAPHLTQVFDLAFNRDGTRLAASGPKWVAVFDTESGALVHEQQVSEAQRSFPVVTFHPNGRNVIVGVLFEPVLRVIDPDTGVATRERTLPWGMVTGPVTVSRDGDRILLGALDGSIRVLNTDLEDAGPPINGVGGTIGVAQLQLLPDDRRALAQRVDASQVLVDLTTGRTSNPGFPHATPGPSYGRALLSPDGMRLAAGNRTGGATIWDLDPELWRRRACEIAGRNLTHSEWDRYLSQLGPYRQTCPEWPPGDS